MVPSAQWCVLGASPTFPLSPPLGPLSAPIFPTCATGEGCPVPELHKGRGHPTLPLRTVPLLLPASGLLLPRLLAQPVGRRPHRGWAADTGSPARLGLRAPGMPPRYPSLAILTLHPHLHQSCSGLPDLPSLNHCSP